MAIQKQSKMKILYSLLIVFVVLSCKKLTLDQLAFPSEKLDSYQFDLYDAGDQSVPAEYSISSNNRTMITLESKDESTGESFKIYGLYIGDTSTISTDTVILYCHGQSLHMDIYYPRATLLANIGGKLNYGVFMFDYRGYGMSEGTSDEAGLSEDSDAAINWLKSKGAKGENTIFYGFSLGCIPVIERAAFKADFTPSKIVIESPLASVANLAQRSTIINVDPIFISTLQFNNAEIIKSVKLPMLWLHGVEDDYVAIQNGELIYNNHSGAIKEAIRVEVAGHSDIPKIYGYANYINMLDQFILK